MGTDLAVPEAALAQGEWALARAGFEAALAVDETPEALDGLGRALWWLAEPVEAISLRERATALYRRQGDARAAVRLALWLSREYRAVHGNHPAADGWHARAERDLASIPEGPEHGWLLLTQAELQHDPARVASLAAEALRLAAEYDDPDLQIRALSKLGHAEVSRGCVAEGMRHIDEAMATVTSGEAASPETVGETMCQMFAAVELASDRARMRDWSDVATAYMARHSHGSLIAFCSACCAEMLIGAGKVEAAEKELSGALRRLTRKGHLARCVHPAGRLAELRALQGRFEEAARLLEGFEDVPETVAPRATLAIAAGDLDLAAHLVERELVGLGRDSLLSVPHLSRLVEIRVAQGDLVAARAVASRLAAVAHAAGIPRLDGEARRAEGRVALAAGEQEALSLLADAVESFVAARLPIDAARARLLRAEASADSLPVAALGDAQAALKTFESVGAVVEADAAAAVVRRLGGPARTGPKGYGQLSRREQEVLDLLSDGLTNAEIAARLFISVKTAGNHVSSILSKLGLRSRGEAAVYAVRSKPGHVGPI
ncbi:MAG: helix-turn-helix transcriptional regulator [Actinomycetota bacterium]|nr:helix-turn-helix transcriptional regulator [Actinomycetota bacterium]